jgi:MFS family permease
VTQPYPQQRLNFLLFGVDYTFFALAMGFLNLNTVMPAFATQLGASPTVVGTLLTVFMIFWTLPQLIAGNVVSRVPKKKPFLLKMAFLGRPIILVTAVVIALTQAQPAWLNLAMLYVAFGVLFGTDGFASVAWFDLLARAFPAEKRGGYIATWQVAKSLGLAVAAVLVGFILSDSGPAFPYNYALMFLAAGLCLMGSGVALSQLHDPPLASEEPPTTYIPWREFGGHVMRLLRDDRRLRQISLARVLFTLSTMAFPFYILYATTELKFPDSTIGLFILAQTGGTLLASLVLGRIPDREGAQRTIQIGSALMLSAPLLALVITLVSPGLMGLLSRGYAWIYICIGLADNLIMLGYLNYVFDITPPGQRSIYMGTFNALATVGVVGPTIAGWLLTWTSYTFLFVLSLLIGGLALIVAFRLPPVRGRRLPDSPEPAQPT